MFLTVHTPASIIIGKLISNPILAFVLAFVFHFILDAIPHDPFIPENVFLLIAFMDLLLVCFLIFVLYKKKKIKLNSVYVFAILGGIVPDAMWFFSELINHKLYFLKLHTYFHHEIIHKMFYSQIFLPVWLVVLVQGSFLFLGLFVFLKIKKRKI